jgi:hypothetical protein
MAIIGEASWNGCIFGDDKWHRTGCVCNNKINQAIGYSRCAGIDDRCHHPEV